jgi:tetratricopeptide (TPR) repeat protein
LILEKPKATRLIPFLIPLLGILCYANSLDTPFVFDDLPHIADNPKIRQLWPPGYLQETTRPLVMLSLGLNYAAGGLAVRSYHLVNLAIHVCAALALYGLVRRTLLTPSLKARYGTSATPLAAAVSLVWLVHPLQTESVTYTIQRAESMMGLFYLLTLYALSRHNAPAPWIWTPCAMACCALGMGTKPIMATAPLTALLYDRAFLSGSFRKALSERKTLYAGLVAAWALLLLLLNAPHESKESAGFDIVISPVEYLQSQPGVLLHYLRLSIWPDRLCLDYLWPITRSAVSIAIPSLLIGLLLLASLWSCFRHSGWGFLGGAFFLILAPTSSVIPLGDLAVEHRMYLPLAVLTTAAAIGIHEAIRRLHRLIPSPATAPSVLGMICLVIAVTGFGWRTARRNMDYRNGISIWRDVVDKRPANHRGHYNLGRALVDAGDIDQGMTHFREAIRLNPDYAEAHGNLGIALAIRGNEEEAINHLREAIRLQPDLVQASDRLSTLFYNQGNLAVQRGAFEQAAEYYREAIALRPDFVQAHSNLGVSLFRLGKTPEAIAHFREALRFDPDHRHAAENLKIALGK